jgi:hypothetical protein
VDAKLTTLLCKNITVAKSKEVKPDTSWHNLLRKAMAQKRAVFLMMTMMMTTIQLLRSLEYFSVRPH